MNPGNALSPKRLAAGARPDNLGCISYAPRKSAQLEQLHTRVVAT